MGNYVFYLILANKSKIYLIFKYKKCAKFYKYILKKVKFKLTIIFLGCKKILIFIIIDCNLIL